MSVATVLQQLIANALGVDPSEVTADARFTDDFGADRCSSWSSSWPSRRQFGIEIARRGCGAIDSVRDAVA